MILSMILIHFKPEIINKLKELNLVDSIDYELEQVKYNLKELHKYINFNVMLGKTVNKKQKFYRYRMRYC